MKTATKARTPAPTAPPAQVDTEGNPAAPRGASSAALTVRPAGPRDEVPLGFFFDTLLRRDYFLRRGQLSEMLKSRRHRVWVAEIDRILVGAAITTRGTRLVNALVHPGYRGLGIGRALVRATGAKEVRAKLDVSTGDPRGFYERLGYVSTGERNDRGNIELMRARGAQQSESEVRS